MVYLCAFYILKTSKLSYSSIKNIGFKAMVPYVTCFVFYDEVAGIPLAKGILPPELVIMHNKVP